MPYVPPTITDAPRLPFGCYRVWIKSIDHKPSKAGNPMSVLSLQVLSPDRVTLKDGTIVDTAGTDGQMRFVFSTNALPYTLKSVMKLGIALPTDTESEADFVAKIQAQLSTLVGQTFELTARSEKSELRDANGDPIKDSTGRVIEGQEWPVFEGKNIVGNIVPLSQLGVTPQPY